MTAPRTRPLDRILERQLRSFDTVGLGQIESALIETRTGKVSHLVIRPAGASDLRAIPWEHLELDHSSGDLLVGLSRRRIQSGPSVATIDEPCLRSEEWLRRNDAAYQARPPAGPTAYSTPNNDEGSHG